MKTKQNLQEKVNELENIVKYFEDSNKDFNLDEGLEKYDQAMSMVDEVKKQLKSYKLKIQEIQQKYSEEPSQEELV